MVYLCRDGSEGFVWQQICGHLKQLREKFGGPKLCADSDCSGLRVVQVDGYDEDDGIRAIQAALTHGILCSTCASTVARLDADWVVASLEVLAFGSLQYDADIVVLCKILGRKCFSDCARALDVAHVCSSWREWIKMESLRR